MPEIAKLELAHIRVPIKSTSPLLCDNWPEWALQELRDRNAKKKVIKQIITPDDQYLATLYRIAKDDGTEGCGFPSAGFWKATLGAFRYYGRQIKRTELQQNIRVHGVLTDADRQVLTEIFGEHKLREDRIGTRSIGGGSQLAYRAEFPEWTAVLDVEYVATSIEEDTVLSLIYGGGVGVGIGNWRPEKGGTFGTYTLDTDKPMERWS